MSIEETKGIVTRYQEEFWNSGRMETAEDIVAKQEKAVARWTFTGTHEGELLGMAATGNKVTLEGTTIVHSSGGKITETWVFWDRLSLMEQLGVA